MLKFLPLLLAVLALISGIFYFQRREALKKKMDELLQKSKISMNSKLPEPTTYFKVKDSTDLDNDYPTVTPTATPTPTPETENMLTPMPTTTEKETKKTVSSKTTTRTELVCTPVYGMANSCAEHTVVDTGLDSGTFINLAGLSYLGGLFAFVKAKRRN